MSGTTGVGQVCSWLKLNKIERVSAKKYSALATKLTSSIHDTMSNPNTNM